MQTNAERKRRVYSVSYFSLPLHAHTETLLCPLSTLLFHISSSSSRFECLKFLLSSCMSVQSVSWMIFGVVWPSVRLLRTFLFSALVHTATQKPTALKSEQLGQWQVMVLACVPAWTGRDWELFWRGDGVNINVCVYNGVQLSTCPGGGFPASGFQPN